MKRNKSKLSLDEAIIDLYLNVKIRKQEEIETIDDSALDTEKDKLRKLDPVTIIGYIKKSIEILVDIKVQEKLQLGNEYLASYYGNDWGMNEYEKLLRKLEADIRNFIKIEHQLKLHAENLQIRNEELEHKLENLKHRLNSNSHIPTHRNKIENINNTHEDVLVFKNEISSLQQLIKTYEQHNLKIPVLEQKLRRQNIEFKNLDAYYKEKIRSFSKKIKKYEEALKSQNNSIREGDLSANLIPTAANQSRTHSPDISFKTNRTIDRDVEYASNRTEKCRKIPKAKITSGAHKVNIPDLSIERTKTNQSSTSKIEPKHMRGISQGLDSQRTKLPIAKSKNIHSMMNKGNMPLKGDNTRNNIPSVQANAACYNNINIFTGGINNVKAGEINLRNFIFNKVANPNKRNIGMNSNSNRSNTSLHNKSTNHARSNSMLGN